MDYEKPSYPHYRLPLESFDVKYGIAVRNRMNPHGVGTSIYKREKTSVRRIATQGRHRLNSLVPNKPLRQEFAEWMDKSHKVGAAIVAGGATGEGGLYHAFLRDKGLLAVRGQANGLVYARNVTETKTTVAGQSTPTATIQFDPTLTVSGTVEYPTMPQPAPATAYLQEATEVK